MVVACACAGLGCDKLFSLQHVSPNGGVMDAAKQIDGAPLPDAACGVSGGISTVMLGARFGGPGQASMTDTFVVDTPNRTQNYGAALTLALCNTCSAGGAPWDGSVAVSLLRFDTTPICPGSTIQSAELLIDTTDDNLGAGLVGVFVVREQWDEGSGGTGGAAGAANWTERQVGVAWSAAGVGTPGSRDAAPVATFAPLDKNVPYSVTLSPLVVQDWLANSGTNFGLLLAITSGGSDCQFYSREGGALTQRPGLRVTAKAP